MPHDDELTISLLTRAWESGFDVCMLTTDTWQLAWRHNDISTGNYGTSIAIPSHDAEIPTDNSE
jgi:isopentenyl diphosphate isomerase/L-lactate dehydrogenase-like FMN-dependent dehydrogenase